jgi:dolichol-phosphate mannosyltransferase
MDADMSHPPEMVPKLVSACRSPSVDFAIGSRYSAGSSAGANWSLNSRVASFLARGLTAARDPLSGFFAVKRSTLKTAAELRQPGDKIGLETIVRCDCRRIVEVPITFRNRVFGQSNRSLFEQRQYGRQLASLYQAKYPGLTRIIRFGLVGLSGAAVDLIGFSLLLLWAPLWFSRATGIACATLWNFAWNRQITFRSAADTRVLRQLVTYFGATLLGAATNCSMTILLCNSCRLFNTIPTLAGAIGAAAGAAVNFLLCRRWVFKESNAVRVDTDQVQASPASTANRRVA